MGTHPIFESDFDCLTENEFKKMPSVKRTIKDNEIGNNAKLSADFTGTAEDCELDVSGNTIDGTLSAKSLITKGDGKVLQTVKENKVKTQNGMKGDVLTATEDQKVHVEQDIEKNKLADGAQVSLDVTSLEAQQRTEQETIENARETQEEEIPPRQPDFPTPDFNEI